GDQAIFFGVGLPALGSGDGRSYSCDVAGLLPVISGFCSIFACVFFLIPLNLISSGDCSLVDWLFYVGAQAL
ncbi:unnamed protein product, partial [Brassica oleracea var. botrytis]